MEARSKDCQATPAAFGVPGVAAPGPGARAAPSRMGGTRKAAAARAATPASRVPPGRPPREPQHRQDGDYEPRHQPGRLRPALDVQDAQEPDARGQEGEGEHAAQDHHPGARPRQARGQAGPGGDRQVG